MKKIYVLLLAVCTCHILHIRGQGYGCLSNFRSDSIAQFNPSLYSEFLQYEQHVSSYLQSMSNSQNQRLIAANSTIIIPVVVHILYNNSSQNISDAVINSQIRVLNEDFRRLNADRFNAPTPFQAVGGDMNFEFRLACIDPNGNPTNGITRTPTSTVLFGLDKMKSSTTGGKDPWNTSAYLNIWVCNTVVANGYAQFPALYPTAPEKDGIVIGYNVFGVTDPTSPKGLGRVGTHEIGHWLGLYHPYDGSLVQTPCDYYDDLVDDTPRKEPVLVVGQAVPFALSLIVLLSQLLTIVLQVV